MDLDIPKPAFVFIHGGIDTELIRNLIAIGYPLRGVVVSPDAPQFISDPDIQSIVISLEDAYAALVSSDVSDLIVADGSVDDGAAQISAYHAADNWAPVSARLLHPAATIPFFRVRYPGLYACIGFPGSGNIVVQAVLQEIQRAGGVRHNLGYEPLCTKLARNSTFFLRGFLDEALSSLGPFETSMGHGASEHIGVRLRRSDGNFLYIQDMPYCGWIGQNFGGHVFMSQRLKYLFEEFGYTFFHALRNPLDAIVSNASKTTRPPEFALNNPAWQEMLSGRFKRYTRDIDLIRSVAHEVRFDQLLINPAQEISECAQFLNVSIDEQACGNIWDAVGMKPLTPAGAEHFFDPQSDKTRHLSREIVAALQTYGVQEISKRYEYPWPSDDYLAETNEPTDANMIRVSPLYGIGMPSEKTELKPGIICESNDPDFLRVAVDLLSSSQYRRYYAMLGLFSDINWPTVPSVGEDERGAVSESMSEF
jgi:hypothetical protein